MIFTTPQFVLFAVLFFAGYSVLRGRARKVWLLAASYFFYGSWNAKFLLLIIGSSLLDYYIGAAIYATPSGSAAGAKRRRRLIMVSLVGNLGVLAIFKYFNFFASSVVGLLSALGLSVSPVVLDVLLPVGISFYTFQTLTYSIDIYRGTLAPTRSMLDFCLYVAFFPQLVAGPIERAHHLLPQMSVLERRINWSGMGLIALGAFKKAVIADHMAALVATAYANPADAWAGALWIATYAFAAQIYCDFSGYSDIAVGLGRLLGIEVVQNFRSPYSADGPSDFWRRWHISLSSWLRDYLYIPLGGNRGSRLFTWRNLMLTMLLGGLWHGAAWNFVLWGAFHGVLLIVLRPVESFELAKDAPLALQTSLRFARRIVFFHVTCIGWALFRAQTFSDCFAICKKLLGFEGFDFARWGRAIVLSGEGKYLAFMMLVVAALVLFQNITRSDSKALVAKLWSAPSAVRFVVVVVLLVATMLLSLEKPPPFIYFQF
ncbi:MAG: MBOAT family protein [Myxococcales bacterium]|nr:MBOAT family protein [Myxococcales bacterium]